MYKSDCLNSELLKKFRCFLLYIVVGGALGMGIGSHTEFQIKDKIKSEVEKVRKLIASNHWKSLTDYEGLVIEKLHINQDIASRKVSDLNKHFQRDEGRHLQDISENALECIAYQNTPLRRTLQLILNFLKQNELQKLRFRKRLLFIVSDGLSTDGDPVELTNQIKSLRDGVIIICCYITDKKAANPKELYSSDQREWDKGAKAMFNMSSDVSNFEPPLSFLAIRAGFKLSDTGRSRLFLQANNQEVMKEFFNFMIRVKDHTDSLLDLIGDIDLEPYIKSSSEFESRNQQGGTCYANAIAATYCMAMKRIFQRQDGYPGFSSIRDKLIEKYGTCGAITEEAIRDTCKLFRLQFKKVDIQNAKHALNKFLTQQDLIQRLYLEEAMQQFQQVMVKIT